MAKFIIRRLLQAFITLIGVSALSFFLIKMAPGDYLDKLKLNPQISKETIELLRKTYGLDRNPLVQYLLWLKSALLFDLGYSFTYHEKVLKLILERVPNTLLLTLSSAFLSWLFAFLLGFLSALKKGSLWDKVLRFYSYVFMSIPSFFLVFILIFLASKSQVIPVGGLHSPDYESLSFLGKVLDLLKHMLVPVLSIVLVSTANLLRLVRSAVIEVLESPLMEGLRARGCGKRVLLKHLLKNSLNPFITLLGYEIGYLLSGSALIEIIVGWPGMGMLILEAVLSNDLYLVMGSLWIGTIMLLLGNLLADIALALLDPRIRERELL